jgi:hypothetical protein
MIDENLRANGFPDHPVTSSSRERVLKLKIRPKAEDDHVRNMDVPAGLDNALEVRAHVPARSDVKPVEEFQRKRFR